MKILVGTAIGIGALLVIACPRLVGDGDQQNVRISAGKQTETFLYLRKGERATIRASGTWKMGDFVGSCGPDGFEDGVFKRYNITQRANHGELIARVGSGTWQRVGSDGEITADEDGYVFLTPNDTERGNNSGQLSVTLSKVSANGRGARSGGSKSETIRVSASSSAFRSGIFVTKGQRVSIRATGTWRMGPVIGACDADGMTFVGDEGYNRFKTSKHGTLMAMIKGDDGWYGIGSSGNFRADVSGELLFAPNDTEVGNNSGQLSVSVDITDD